MKFCYQFRTPDNAVHTGTVSARNRDAAFALLKEQGVRPFGLCDAPGFWNKVLGRGKRYLVIGLLLITIVLLALLLNRTTHELEHIQDHQRFAPRHQVYGDPALMEELWSSEFAAYFDHPGERFLAYYAQPGDDSVPMKISPEQLRDSLAHEIVFKDDDAREARELRAIVSGMKSELREYLKDGKGTPASYIGRLEERRVEERRIYDETAAQLENERDDVIWETKNETLRALGLRTVARSKKNQKN